MTAREVIKICKLRINVVRLSPKLKLTVDAVQIILANYIAVYEMNIQIVHGI